MARRSDTPPVQGGAPQNTIHDSGRASAYATEHTTDALSTSRPKAGLVAPQTIPCPTCDAPGPHYVGPGAEPHYARLVCRACGRFLRWLPKPREGAI
jgi:hypothetical protein